MRKYDEKVGFYILIDKDLRDRFRDYCKDKGIKHYPVVENFMKNWLKRREVKNGRTKA